MSSSASNKQPLLVDRPALSSTLVSVASGQSFLTSLVPTAVGNATKVFDVDSALTDTSISGAYVDEIWFQYTKRTNLFIDSMAAVTGTYTADTTVVTVTPSGGHNLQIGQKVYLDYSSYSSGSLPADEIITVTDVTASTFTGTTAASVSGPITGNVNIYTPIDFCFYLTSASSITSTTQFSPLFVASIPATYENLTFSLSAEGILPLINHPVVQAGSAATDSAPKMRGLMMRKGQALYVAASGAVALTNGFYVNVQGGYY